MIDTLAPPTSAPPRGPRGTAVLLGLTASLTALLAIAQPVLIGGYLQGSFDLVTVHGINGSMLMLATFVAAVAALLRWTAGHGSGWPAVALAALWCAEFVQLVAGYTRLLWLHVPLGVAIVGTAAFVAAWAWTPAARRPRRGWWR